MGTIADLRAGIEQLDTAVTAAAKGIAAASAQRIRDDYARRLDDQLHPGHSGRTAASAKVVDESDRKQYVVAIPGSADKPANLPLWLEYGTRFMTAKPALRPATAAESDRYRSEMGKAIEAAAEQTLKG